MPNKYSNGFDSHSSQDDYADALEKEILSLSIDEVRSELLKNGMNLTDDSDLRKYGVHSQKVDDHEKEILDLSHEEVKAALKEASITPCRDEDLYKYVPRVRDPIEKIAPKKSTHSSDGYLIAILNSIFQIADISVIKSTSSAISRTITAINMSIEKVQNWYDRNSRSLVFVYILFLLTLIIFPQIGSHLFTYSLFPVFFVLILKQYKVRKGISISRALVEQSFGLNFLGITVDVGKNKGIVSDRESDAVRESFRTIRAHEKILSNQVIVITSSVPGEGKSSTSYNLAHSLSDIDQNVILLEADLRRPGISASINLEGPGMVEVLRGEAYLEDCVKSISGIDIIPSGYIDKYAPDALMAPTFSELIRLLRERYDRIIIDTPPVLAVSDALGICKYVDTYIFIIKADSMSVDTIKKGIEKLREFRVNIAGAIVSRVKPNSLTSYVGDIGHYYDYYGYSRNAKTASKNTQRQVQLEKKVETGGSNLLVRNRVEKDDQRNIAS